MKILFVTTLYPSEQCPQYVIFLEQQANALQELGHEVKVLHLVENGNVADHVVVQHGLQVTSLCVTKKKLSILSPLGLKKPDAEKIKRFMAEPFDVVSVHFLGVQALRTIRKVCRNKNIPIVAHFHGLNVWKDYYVCRPWLNRYQILQKRIEFKKLSGSVGVSQKVSNVFREKIKGVPSYTVYNGVSSEMFSFVDNRFSASTGVTNVLCVANLISIKGQRYLIKAVSDLAKKGKPVTLSLVGRGPDEAELRRYAKECECPVNFLGYVSYDLVAKLMKEHDVFVMPSFFEALGCVYLEAMATGMITVGVQGQGIDEIIRDGENGFLAKPQDSSSIKEILERIMDAERTQLQSISRKARETAEKYGWTASAQQLEKVYFDLKKLREYQ